MCRFRFVLALFILFVAAPAVWAPAWASGGHGGDREEKPQSANVQLGTLTVTMFEHARARGLLFISVNLALYDPGQKDEVSENLPRLRDRYLRVLSQLASTTYSVDRPIDLPSLTSILQSITDKLLGARIVTVQIDNASTRRL